MGMFGEIAAEVCTDRHVKSLLKRWRAASNDAAKDAYRQAILDAAHGYDWDTSSFYKTVLKEIESCAKHTDIPSGTEPTEDDIQRFLQTPEGSKHTYYTAREALRERAYGGKPPGGFGSWGDYWKSL